MARLPYVDPAAAPEAVRQVLQGLPLPLNIFRMMAHAETNFRPLLRLGSSILGEQELSAKLRELAILHVAKLSNAPYEWIQHVPIALAVGASEEQVAALEGGRSTAACFDALEQAVLRFVREVVFDVRATEATFQALAQHLSPRQIVELILAIGYYMMLARLMESTGIDLDPPSGTKVIEGLKRTFKR